MTHYAHICIRRQYNILCIWYVYNVQGIQHTRAYGLLHAPGDELRAEAEQQLRRVRAEVLPGK